ncbi:MAG TPA: metallophosphoesterase [Tepidisphaeraceae bacterium]|jgi:serine/threonine protein phosphatase 1
MRWIIGDVHGMRAALERLLEQVSRIDHQARFYFVGDYVNRGPDSRGVIDLLLSLSNARFVRGNHDDIFDLVVNGAAYAQNAANGDRMVAFQWFMEHGLDQTFASYGVEYACLASCARKAKFDKLLEITQAVPESHRRFVRELPPVIEEPDLFIAHAKWDPYEPDMLPNLAKPLDDNPLWRHKLLWGRYSEEEIGHAKGWRRTGYFGHTPVYAYAASQKTGELLMLPIAGTRIVLVDTGAALNKNGRLTAYNADQNVFVQVDHFANPVTVTA